MKIPNFPKNESQRLDALKHFEILDTPPQTIFDELTKLVSQICGTPIALITLIDETRQWFKSKIGLDVSETPRNISFCGHAILTKGIFEVTDTLLDERFKDNPLVIGSPNIRFYAGIPLTTHEGFSLGTLCVIDVKPRVLTNKQRESLQMLGRQVVSQIEYQLNSLELEKANLALCKANDILYQVTNAMPAMVAYWDSDLLCKFANKSYIDWFGKHPEELIGTNIRDLLGEQLFAMNEAYIRGALSGEKQTFERTLTKADGSIGYTWANYIPDVNVNGVVNGFYVLVSDISAIKSAEADLKLASSFFENTSEGILITDADGAILSVNPAFTEITGYTKENAIGQNARLIKSTRHDDGFYSNLWQSIQGIGVWQGEIWNTHKSGNDYLALMTINKVILIDGTKTNYVGTLIDITESKLQEQKRLADEVSHRDLLVSEVHHRIKNNLQGVAGLLKNFSLEHPETSVLINDAVSQVYAISIIHGLQGKTAISTVRLCELIAEIVASNKHLYRIPITIDIPTHWIPCRVVEIEAVPLALVLNELISNAIKYGDDNIGVNISLKFEPLTGTVKITISNYGQLPEGFDSVSYAVTGKGLQLVSSLLPKKGASLSWVQCNEFVHAKLELESPIFTLEDEELKNYDDFKI